MSNAPIITIALPSLLPVGGVERNSLLLAEQFLRKGYAVDFVIADERNDTKEVIPSQVTTFVFGKTRVRQFVRPFAKYLSERRPAAIISSMWPFTSACIAAHQLSRSKSVILVSDHNPLSKQYANWGFLHKLVMRISLNSYRLADIRLGVSSGVADDVASLSCISRKKFEVINNPIQLSQTSRIESSEEATIWQGWKGPRLITVGRIKEQKNFPLLLQALSILLKQREAKLLILGTGEAEEKVRGTVKQLSLENHVIFGGMFRILRPTFNLLICLYYPLITKGLAT